jgi:NCAIR mutase (PurE)-related protein
MDKKRIKKLLNDIKAKRINVDQALHVLRRLPYEDLGFAKLDTHRALRRGFPEVILCQGKTKKQISKIVEKLSTTASLVMATKASREVYKVIKAVNKKAAYYAIARLVVIGRIAEKKDKRIILIVTAGTSDVPVAEEAAVSAEVMGARVERLYDVGVAGVHRLLDHKEKLFRASVIIVVAGMEGALASVVGGLVDKPIIAVPTSVGYGASFKGLSALLSMLNSCAPGVVAVNIDNGFGAGYFAVLLKQVKR